MPDVMDNLKVAEKIKQLLKEHNMTQEDLANELNITKSAVSQNLRGKSNFDIQNLITISKLFNVSMDELLSLSQMESDNIVTEYKRAVMRGIVSINKIPVSELKIADADLYGKVMVDYIIDADQKDMFTYLHQNGAVFVHNTYHRAANIYYKIIKYMLENHFEGVFKYVLEYTEIKGSFLLDAFEEEVIWTLLNNEKNDQTLKDIINYGKSDGFWKKIFKEQKSIPLSTLDLLEVIAKYKLKHVLYIYLETVSKKEDYASLTKTFKKYQFTYGIFSFVRHHFKEPLNSFDKFLYKVGEVIHLLSELKDYHLMVELLELGLYTNLTDLVIDLEKFEDVKTMDYILDKYSEKLKYYPIAETAVKQKNLVLLEKVKNKLNEEDLNKLLKYIHKDDIQMLKMLFKLGARFTEEHYGFDMFHKINGLIENMLSGDKA